jgi:hypothetical protein
LKTIQLIQSFDDWWGYSPDNGWIVLDRDDPQNAPGTPFIHLIRCRDWVTLSVSRVAWNPPQFIFAKNYIKTLRTIEEQKIAMQDLQLAQLQFLPRRLESQAKKLEAERKKLEAEEAEKRRREAEDAERMRQEAERDWLRTSGVRITRTSGVRITHCWNCITDLDSRFLPECSSCKWMICPVCQACGCNYGGRR